MPVIPIEWIATECDTSSGTAESGMNVAAAIPLVHRGNGRAHCEGAADFLPVELLEVISEIEGQPKRHERMAIAASTDSVTSAGE